MHGKTRMLIVTRIRPFASRDEINHQPFKEKWKNKNFSWDSHWKFQIILGVDDNYHPLLFEDVEYDCHSEPSDFDMWAHLLRHSKLFLKKLLGFVFGCAACTICTIHIFLLDRVHGVEFICQ